jgi:hypothetical protein
MAFVAGIRGNNMTIRFAGRSHAMTGHAGTRCNAHVIEARGIPGRGAVATVA